MYCTLIISLVFQAEINVSWCRSIVLIQEKGLLILLVTEDYVAQCQEMQARVFGSYFPEVTHFREGDGWMTVWQPDVQ